LKVLNADGQTCESSNRPIASLRFIGGGGGIYKRSSGPTELTQA